MPIQLASSHPASQQFDAVSATHVKPNQDWFCDSCQSGSGQNAGGDDAAAQQQADHMPTMLCDTCGGEYTWELTAAFDLALSVRCLGGVDQQAPRP